MHSSDPWRPRVALAVVVLWTAGTAVATPTAVQLVPDELTAYTGTSVLVQSLGADVSKFDYRADVLYLTRAADDGSRTLLTARYLKAVDGSDTYGSVDRFDVSEEAGSIALESADSVVFEMKSHLHMLDVYLPWETLPTFAIPESGTEKVTKEKISVLNLADVDASLRTSAAMDGGSIQVVRELAADEKPGFDFRGNDAKVVLYRLRYTIGKETGRVEAIESECAFEFSQGESKVRLERKVRLEEASTTAIAGADVPAWAGLLKTHRAIEKELDERQKSSQDIGKSIAGFKKSADGTPLAALAGALEFRLQAYQQLFEASQTGQILAGVLGRKAPDFTLKDLDGKDFAFRAATAGNKVTLLSFWGYG